jgi:hypothetical protein
LVKKDERKSTEQNVRPLQYILRAKRKGENIKSLMWHAYDGAGTTNFFLRKKRAAEDVRILCKNILAKP